MLSYMDMFKFYKACGLSDEKARVAANNYLKMQHKFYGENNERR